MITAQEGLVVDVITNESHPEYSVDGFNFGMIRVRLLLEKNSLSDELLPLAHPMYMNNCELPLIGEVVVLYKISGVWHYDKRLSLTKNANMDSAVGHNEIENIRGQSLGQTTSPTGEHIFVKTKKVAEKFLFDESVRFLRPFPGDYIIQGRFGQSMRFGSSKIEKDNKFQHPNILLRVGPPKTAPQTVPGRYGLILEDINEDATSLWLVADQTVPLVPSTTQSPAHLRSSFGVPFKTDKNQLIGVSDQIIFNSKTRSIYLFSGKDVSITTRNNAIIDSEKQIRMTADDDIDMRTATTAYLSAKKHIIAHADINMILQGQNGVQIIGNKVFIGSNKANADKEPMVLGRELSVFLGKLIKALMREPVGLGTMGPVKWNPAIQAALLQLYTLLTPPNPGQASPTGFAGAPFNSEDNFVTKNNQLINFG